MTALDAYGPVSLNTTPSCALAQRSLPDSSPTQTHFPSLSVWHGCLFVWFAEVCVSWRALFYSTHHGVVNCVHMCWNIDVDIICSVALKGVCQIHSDDFDVLLFIWYTECQHIVDSFMKWWTFIQRLLYSFSWLYIHSIWMSSVIYTSSTLEFLHLSFWFLSLLTLFESVIYKNTRVYFTLQNKRTHTSG